jgi:hydrogenase nickel incorporation protein HypA/HybF
MHELGFCEGILEAVQRRAAGRRVKRLRVRVGVLHRLHDQAFQQAFSLAANGTEAEGAILDLIFIPVRSRCHVCRHESEGADIETVCPRCGGMDIEASGGDEIVLEWLEYEIPASQKAE